LYIDILRKKWKTNTFYENTLILVRNLFTIIFKYNINDLPKKSMYEKLVLTVWARQKTKQSMTDSITLYNKCILTELLVFEDAL
jgi:hypothetical protein